MHTISDVDQNQLDKPSLFDSVIIFTNFGQDRVKIEDFDFLGFFNPMPFDVKIFFWIFALLKTYLDWKSVTEQKRPKRIGIFSIFSPMSFDIISTPDFRYLYKSNKH